MNSGGFGIGLVLLLIFLSIVLGALFGKFIYDYILEKKGKDLQSQIEKTQEKSDKIIDKANQRAEKEFALIVERAEKQSLTIIQQIEKKQESIEKKQEIINEKEKLLNLKEEQIDKDLFKISQLTEQEAKKIIFENYEKEYSKDLVNVVEKVKKETLETAKKQANDIIAKTVYRVAIEKSNNVLVDTVELPSEDYKGRIIGREGRNIHFFEEITGVNIYMDDTPGLIKISSFEPEKRFIAKIVLEKLIKDGRINPVYIEKYYTQTLAVLPDILIDVGKETLLELSLPMMDKKILEYIGRFELRYSYGQNLLSHSKEVARISEIMASELGYDPLLAKKAGLLHDIGKIDVNSGESHARVGADILRKYNFNEIIVNSAESHHFEVEQIHPISWIVTAADAISAGREGVRNNTSDKYFERLKELENLVLTVNGVKKAYIMQAGREIRAFIDENVVTDLDVRKINKTIKLKIEENLDYPGIIKIMTIRQNKIIDYIG